jgi:hypothetical protein
LWPIGEAQIVDQINSRRGAGDVQGDCELQIAVIAEQLCLKLGREAERDREPLVKRSSRQFRLANEGVGHAEAGNADERLSAAKP